MYMYGALQIWYTDKKCNFRVVTVRLADFDIPEKSSIGEKTFADLFLHDGTYTQIRPTLLSVSNPSNSIIDKKKNNIYSGASGLLHRKKNIKFHQVLEKF